MASEVVKEDVPSFRKRAGDVVVAGSNNATLVLGADRPRGRESGHGGEAGAGAAYLVVGRSDGDPNLADDDAYVYISMKGDVDSDVGTDGAGTPSTSAASATVKADCVRIVGRHDVKIVVGRCSVVLSEDGTATIACDSLRLGSPAAVAGVLLETLVPWLQTHTHVSSPAGGPTMAPAVPVPQSAVSRKVVSE